MQTKKIEIINHKDIYVAADGTEFENREECTSYEKSALGIALARLHNIAVKESSECDLFNGVGSDENSCRVVIPKDDKDIAVIRQALAIGHYDAQKAVDKVGDEQVGRAVIVTQDYDCDYIWVDTLDAIVERITDGKFKVVPNEQEL